MASLLYIHGFNSSPQSHKAIVTGRWLAQHYPKTGFVCPPLSLFPQSAMVSLERTLAERDEELYLVGSSMGGFYATWLAEKYALKAVLINPAVAPWRGRDYLLGEQVNYHTGERCVFEPHHLQALEAFDVAHLARPEHIKVLLQTGDEVLDYRLAVHKYRACETLVEPGGDHSFQGFERHLPGIMEFFVQGAWQDANINQRAGNNE